MKKSLKFILFLIPWLVSLLFLRFNYLNSLNTLSIIPPNYILVISLLISYLTNAYSTCRIYSIYDFLETTDYNKYLFTNYLFHIFSIISLCLINNLFLSICCLAITLLSLLFLYYEAKSYDLKASKYLIFNIYYAIFIFFITIITYFMNL